MTDDDDDWLAAYSVTIPGAHRKSAVATSGETTIRYTWRA